jgi:hypothetical protein
LPIRLTDLVTGYPYGTYDPQEGLLARPRFSTRQYDSLLISLDSEFAILNSKPPRPPPLQILSDALTASLPETTDDNVTIWARIRSAGSSDGGGIDSSRVFSDDTMMLLTSAAPQQSVPASVQVIPSPAPSRRDTVRDQARARKRSFSVGDPISSSPQEAEPGSVPTTSNTAADSSASWTPADWSQFQSAGFSETPGHTHLASTLMDTDIEKTKPPSPAPLLRRKSSRKRGTSTPPHRGVRLSLDIPATSSTDGASATTAVPLTTMESQTAVSHAEVEVRVKAVVPVQLDEAFVDFYADAAGDPIAARWPSFVVAELRTPHTTDTGTSVRFVVIERTFSRPPPPAPTPSAVTPTTRPASPLVEAASPASPRKPKPSRPSASTDRMSSTFSATKKRFTLFSRTSSGQGKESRSGKGAKSPVSQRVGEMGEVLSEEPETASPSKQPADSKTSVVEGGGVAAGVAALATAAGVTAAVVADSEANSDELVRPEPGVPQPATTEPLKSEPVHNAEEMDGNGALPTSDTAITAEVESHPEEETAPAPETNISSDVAPAVASAIEPATEGAEERPSNAVVAREPELVVPEAVVKPAEPEFVSTDPVDDVPAPIASVNEKDPAQSSALAASLTILHADPPTIVPDVPTGATLAPELTKSEDSTQAEDMPKKEV